MTNEALDARVAALEKWAHEPFDFTNLVGRLERLERAAARELRIEGRTNADIDRDLRDAVRAKAASLIKPPGAGIKSGEDEPAAPAVDISNEAKLHAHLDYLWQRIRTAEQERDAAHARANDGDALTDGRLRDAEAALATLREQVGEAQDYIAGLVRHLEWHLERLDQSALSWDIALAWMSKLTVLLSPVPSKKQGTLE